MLKTAMTEFPFDSNKVVGLKNDITSVKNGLEYLKEVKKELGF